MANTKPTKIAFTVIERGKDENGESRSVWVRIGAAWDNQEGKGSTILLDALPLDGKIVLLENENGAKEESDDQSRPNRRFRR